MLDSAPRSMALEIRDFQPPARALAPGVELRAGTPEEVAAINDQAYGLQGAWSAALTKEPEVEASWMIATWSDRPVAGAPAIDVGDDVCVTAVGTLPEWQGMGLASALIDALLTDAAERGLRSASLQASRAGAPVYARLGFRDVGHTEMWEKRAPDVGRLPQH